MSHQFRVCVCVRARVCDRDRSITSFVSYYIPPVCAERRENNKHQNYVQQGQIHEISVSHESEYVTSGGVGGGCMKVLI